MIEVYSRSDLGEIIWRRIEEQGPKCDLNDIDVSGIPDMSYMFYSSQFNGDLSKWDVSSVKDMGFMFSNSPLNSKRLYWYDPKRTEL